MKELILIIMMIGFGTIMKVQTIAAQPSVTSARYKLPANQVIDIADVPVVVLNGLNNTYTYNEIEKVEVCTYNDADIYKFTLLIGNDKEKVVYFSPVGVEI